MNQIAARPQQQTMTASATGQSDQQRAIAEVQAAMMIARMNPRDVMAARDRILLACTRPKLAEASMYSYARGGQDITGPSIRLAEAMAQGWGNMSFGVRELEQRAEQAVQALRSGMDLATAAKRYSDAGEPEMGLRPLERYPQAFVQAVGTTPEGGLVGPLRTPAGFHILVVLDKRTAGVPSVVTQNHARHILLRPSAQLTETQAAAQLQELRQRIERGQASFAQLAQQYSQDGSAPQGGDLGWSSPGQFVPEFEDALNRLQPGEISQPIVSRFGVHLITLEERRQVTLNPRQQREMLRNVVREEKVEKAYATWLQELRSQAYVEYRNTEERGL